MSGSLSFKSDKNILVKQDEVKYDRTAAHQEHQDSPESIPYRLSHSPHYHHEQPLIAPLPLMIMRLYIRINVVPLNAVMRSKLLSGLLLPAGTVVARTDALTERLQ